MELLLVRGVWKCAGAMPGVLCVTTFGGTPMLMLFANSWDFPDIVSDLSGAFSWLNEEISVTNFD